MYENCARSFAQETFGRVVWLGRETGHNLRRAQGAGVVRFASHTLPFSHPISGEISYRFEPRIARETNRTMCTSGFTVSTPSPMTNHW